MSREYFVIDGEGFISYAADHEPEAFATFAAAKKRAVDLAKSEPGHTVTVSRAIAYVACPVAAPEVELRKLK